MQTQPPPYTSFHYMFCPMSWLLRPYICTPQVLRLPHAATLRALAISHPACLGPPQEGDEDNGVPDWEARSGMPGERRMALAERAIWSPGRCGWL